MGNLRMVRTESHPILGYGDAYLGAAVQLRGETNIRYFLHRRIDSYAYSNAQSITKNRTPTASLKVRENLRSAHVRQAQVP